MYRNPIYGAASSRLTPYCHLICHMENRVKEQQLWLFADRTVTIRANQQRPYLSAFAGIPVTILRRVGLQGTGLATARIDTIRSRLPKLAWRIRVAVRRVWLPFASVFPLQMRLSRRSPTCAQHRCVLRPGNRAPAPDSPFRAASLGTLPGRCVCRRHTERCTRHPQKMPSGLDWRTETGLDPAGTPPKAAFSASSWPPAVKTPKIRPHRGFCELCGLNLLELSRGHREFEFRGHLTHATTFGEDACQVRKDHGPVSRALCNDLAIAVAFLTVKDRSTRKKDKLWGHHQRIRALHITNHQDRPAKFF